MLCELELNEARTQVICKNCRQPFPVTAAEIKEYNYDISKFDRYCTNFNAAYVEAPAKKIKLPPLWRRTYNFLKALVIHIFKRNPRVSKRVVKKRLTICQACPKNLYYAGYCLHASCGCPIHDRDTYASKLYWRDGKCPLGYW